MEVNGIIILSIAGIILSIIGLVYTNNKFHKKYKYYFNLRDSIDLILFLCLLVGALIYKYYYDKEEINYDKEEINTFRLKYN